MKRGARPFHLQRPSITFLQLIPGPSPMTPPNWKQRQEVLLYTFSSVTLPAHSLQVPRRGAVICINYSRRGPCIPGTHLSPLHVPSGPSLFSLSSLLSSKEYLLSDSCQLGQSFGGQAPGVCVWGVSKSCTGSDQECRWLTLLAAGVRTWGSCGSNDCSSVVRW